MMVGHVLQPQETQVMGAYLGVSQVEGFQEAALGVGGTEEEGFLREEAQIPVMMPQNWGLKVERVQSARS